MKIKIVKKKESHRLSFFSKLLIFAVIILIIWLFVRKLNSFLTINKPIDCKTLVAEGWLPDYAIKQVIDVYDSGNYENLIITGLPIEKGYYTSVSKTYADIAVATLNELGFDTNLISKVTIPRSINKDRTYATAIALSIYLEKNHADINKINIYTIGCHGRRSLYLFKKALSPEIEAGVISVPDKSYDFNKWWNSSRGFRSVMNEAIAYLYIKLFYYPDKQNVNRNIIKGKYLDKIENTRQRKNINFLAGENSPLTKNQKKSFRVLNYFKPDPAFKVRGQLKVDTSEGSFKMKTSTSRLPEYRKYGVVYFKIDTTLCQLTLFQNIELLKSQKYRDRLFIPFRDKTSGKETYGGGRYLDIKIPESETDSIFIDFNLAYNPYCAYNARYSCPIPPEENNLIVAIKAGEKSFKNH